MPYYFQFMKWLKKTLRVVGLVLLIILAACGIFIIGGAPVPPLRRKENTIEIVTELIENKEKESDVAIFKFKE